jgi:hypothetical protein
MEIGDSRPRIVRSIILRQSIPPDRIIQGSNARLILGNVIYFPIPVLIATVAVTYINGPLPWPINLAVYILLVGIVGFAFWLQLGIIVSYGIVVQPEGVAVLRYNRPAKSPSKTYFQVFAPWELLTSVRMQGLFSEYVSLGKGPLGRDSIRVLVDRKEARTILSDPRCPLYGRVPEKAARKLGLERFDRTFTTQAR